MWTKALLIAAAVLLLAQNISAKGEHKARKGVREYVEIANATYFVDAITGYYRDEAQTMCESLNMTLITFEDPAKWTAVNDWLATTTYENYWFWNGALRDLSNTTWYWEVTGEPIVDFYWAPDQPTMDNTLTRSCINFSKGWGGWDDDECYDYSLDAICQ